MNLRGQAIPNGFNTWTVMFTNASSAFSLLRVSPSIPVCDLCDKLRPVEFRTNVARSDEVLIVSYRVYIRPGPGAGENPPKRMT